MMTKQQRRSYQRILTALTQAVDALDRATDDGILEDTGGYLALPYGLDEAHLIMSDAIDDLLMALANG
jgi:hypothetical protein